MGFHRLLAPLVGLMLYHRACWTPCPRSAKVVPVESVILDAVLPALGGINSRHSPGKEVGEQTQIGSVVGWQVGRLPQWQLQLQSQRVVVELAGGSS